MNLQLFDTFLRLQCSTIDAAAAFAGGVIVSVVSCMVLSFLLTVVGAYPSWFPRRRHTEVPCDGSTTIHTSCLLKSPANDNVP
jgi:hypothetical protein